ncbi:MAG TPA: DNA/RNA non-specific endonuclease [Allosphingosinicella sp.]|jgi:hypothetical protein|nr:DNA/RNA non-specific endonuclease [Allosphingosinicella sp.]
MSKKPKSGPEITSLLQLRPLHVALLQEWSKLDDAQKRERGEAFRATATSAGRWIKNLEERDGAQALLDYWTATIGSIPGQAYPELVALAPFDPATVQTSGHESPFVGLDPFHIEDKERFHGRDQVRDELLAASEANPLLIVTGPSAIGKSSLVQAGVAGTLKAQPGWTVLAPVTPGGDPVASLLLTVRPDKAPRGWLDEQRTRLESDPDHLRLLAEDDLAADKGVLLVIDRAEEMFTFDVGNAEIGVAAAALAAFVAGPQPGRHRVILDIRSDYLEQLTAALKAAKVELPETAVARPRAPTPDELRQAVVRPAESVGQNIEPAVTDALVADLDGQADALPLLELTLSKLWEAAETDRVGMAEYQAVGRPSLIVQNVAERVYAALDPAASHTAHLAFLQMIRVSHFVSRRRVRRDDLREALEKTDADTSRLTAVLKAFDKAGLIRRFPGDNAGDDCFEIAHEAVIRNWPRLLIWLQDLRRGDETRERLMAALERWRAGGRRAIHLLNGQGLRDAVPYHGTSAAFDEFVAASRKRRRMLATIALTVLLIALVWTGVSIWRTLTAESKARLAEGNELVARGVATARESEARLLRAQVNAREHSIAQTQISRDFQRRAMMADQILMALFRKGTIGPSGLPPFMVARMARTPDAVPAGPLVGFDPDFLIERGGARDLAVPLPPVPSPDVEIVNYPHATVFYDGRRHIPLLVMSNFDPAADPIPPFQGIGVFRDTRVRGTQIDERVSPAPDKGLVPIITFQEVAWTNRAGPENSGFLHYAPLTVLMPWGFYQGAWLGVETGLLDIVTTDRITYLTGPILRPGDPAIGDIPIPQAYFKIAIYRDRTTGRRAIQARMIGINAGGDGTNADRSLARIIDLARRGGIDLRPLNLTPSG